MWFHTYRYSCLHVWLADLGVKAQWPWKTSRPVPSLIHALSFICAWLAHFFLIAAFCCSRIVTFSSHVQEEHINDALLTLKLIVDGQNGMGLSIFPLLKQSFFDFPYFLSLTLIIIHPQVIKITMSMNVQVILDLKNALMLSFRMFFLTFAPSKVSESREGPLWSPHWLFCEPTVTSPQSCLLYSHRGRSRLAAVSTEAPPTSCWNLLFERGIQSDESWLIRKVKDISAGFK